MSFFNKKSASEPVKQPDKPGNNKLALIILIVLVAVFGYLYFFTSLIVPHGAPPVPPPAPPPQVKQAMPPRSSEVATAPAGAVKPPAPVPTTPGAAVKTPPSPAPAPAAAAKTPPAPAPAPAPSAKTPPAPAPAPAAQKPAPQVPAKGEAKSAPSPKKVEQKPAETAQKKKSFKAAGQVKKRKELFTLNLGEFSSEAQANAAEEKLVQLKIKPVSKRQAQKSRKMNRLFYNVYSEYDTYSAELEKLKKLASNAFAIEKDGKYYVYTGSYSSAELARKEQKRLSASGVKVLLQKVKLPLSLVQISAGKFSSRAEADRAAASLRRQGLKPMVAQTKK